MRVRTTLLMVSLLFYLGLFFELVRDVSAQCSGSYNCGSENTEPGNCVGGSNAGGLCGTSSDCPGGVCVGNYTTCDPVTTNNCSGSTEYDCGHSSAGCTDCIAAENCTWNGVIIILPTPTPGETPPNLSGAIRGRVWVDANGNGAFDDGDSNIVQNTNGISCGSYYNITNPLYIDPLQLATGYDNPNWEMAYHTQCWNVDGKPRYAGWVGIEGSYRIYAYPATGWEIVTAAGGTCGSWNGIYIDCNVPRFEDSGGVYLGSETADLLRESAVGDLF